MPSPSSQTPYDRALDLLTARAYSSKELHRKLVQKGATLSEADSVIARLLDNGLLDDRRYALSYARTKFASGGASPRRVKQELARKGIAQDIAAKAIEQLESDEEVDHQANLEQVARKKLAQMGDLPPLTLRRRLYGFLARRGYDVDEIQTVVAALISSH